MDVNTLHLRYAGREQTLLVPTSLPREGFAKDVFNALGLPTDADVTFQSEGKHVAFTAMLPNGFRVDVLVRTALGALQELRVNGAEHACASQLQCHWLSQ
jgi:hypothetical protein